MTKLNDADECSRACGCYVACPECDGDKTMTAVFVKYAPGHSGPPVRELPCHVCDGRGEVSSEHVLRMERGEKFRHYRLRILGYGLREAADRWGMKASELSYIEQGKTVTDWTPPGWADSST
jgi:hypothetical protein